MKIFVKSSTLFVLGRFQYNYYPESSISKLASGFKSNNKSICYEYINLNFNEISNLNNIKTSLELSF